MDDPAVGKVPFADSTHWVNSGFGEEPEHLNELLARASRIVRAECANRGVNIDRWIADRKVDADLVADVVCDMVRYATASPAGVGIDSLHQSAGPYQETLKYSNPVGNMSFTKVHMARLGISKGKAWSIDLLAGVHD